VRADYFTTQQLLLSAKAERMEHRLHAGAWIVVQAVSSNGKVAAELGRAQTGNWTWHIGSDDKSLY
jgi:hypothetical protein